MKNVLKGLVKTRVKEQVSRILPRVEESVNTTLEAEVLTRSSHSSRIPILLPLTYQKWNSRRSLSKRWKEINKAILDTYRESTILKRRREDDDQEGPSAGPNRGSKRQKEGAEQASASTPSEKATKGAGESTTGTQSRQQSASQSAYAEEPVQTTYTLTPDLLVGPTYKFMKGSCSSLTKLEYHLEYHLEEVYKATTDQLDW
nr:hypothetical protein [Tanacetum cinerariifolium]